MSNKELTSVLLSGLAVTGGVLATAATGGAAPISGLIFTGALAALSGIGGNLLSSYLEKKFVNPTPKDEILRNGDLTRAVGKAIFILINDEANKADYEISREIVKHVGKSEGEEWEKYLAERLQVWEEYIAENIDKETQIIDKNKTIYSKLNELLPAQLTKYIKAREGEIDNVRALTPETWAIIVKGVFRSHSYHPNDEDCLRIGKRLHQDFPQALRKVLIDDFSQDGKAFASMQFRLLSEILYYSKQNYELSDSLLPIVIEISKKVDDINQNSPKYYAPENKAEWREIFDNFDSFIEKFEEILKIVTKLLDVGVENLELGKSHLKIGAKSILLEQEQVNLLRQIVENQEKEKQVKTKLQRSREFHLLSKIPPLPNPYIAHPYLLQEATPLIGRNKELKILNEWISNPESEYYKTRVMSFIAMGGMGKSALTWKWFVEVTSPGKNVFDGAVWWSFYAPSGKDKNDEQDKDIPSGDFNDFVLHTLAYISDVPVESIQDYSAEERLKQLELRLKEKNYLIVLDGLERLLRAYRGNDRQRVERQDFDSKTKNFEVDTSTMSENERYSYEIKKGRRQALFPEVDNFLQKLTLLTNSRILISSRLLPAALQNKFGKSLNGNSSYFLKGLEIPDALKLWESLEVKGNAQKLIEFFEHINRYPLLIVIFASAIRKTEKAKDNFDEWIKLFPDFNSIFLINDIEAAINKVLEYSLQPVSKNERTVLNIISKFPSSISYELIAKHAKKMLPDSADLDQILYSLRGNSLISRDQFSYRYEMHPVISLYVSSTAHINTPKFNEEFINLVESEKIVSESLIKTFSDLEPQIIQYNEHIRNENYNEAAKHFWEEIQSVTRFNLGVCEERLELLEMLVPESGESKLEFLNDENKARILFALAETYGLLGQAKNQYEFILKAIPLFEKTKNNYYLAESLRLRNGAILALGNIFEAETQVSKLLIKCRELQFNSLEAVVFWSWISVLILREDYAAAAKATLRSAQILYLKDNFADAYSIECFYSMSIDDYESALNLAGKELSYCLKQNLQFGFVCALRNKGIAQLNLGYFEQAENTLMHALSEAQQRHLDSEEIEISLNLAKLYFKKQEYSKSRQWLNVLLDNFTQCLSPFGFSDALIILSELEWESGNKKAAIKAAQKAYKLAWCDGPPYAYYRNLSKSKDLLFKYKKIAGYFSKFVSNTFDVLDYFFYIEGIQKSFENYFGLLPKGLIKFDYSRLSEIESIEIESTQHIIYEKIIHTVNWSEEEIFSKYEAIRNLLLDWENTEVQAREWWQTFEAENNQRMALVLRLAEELAIRKATIDEFFLTYTISDTENIQANLCYLDYNRIKKQEAGEILEQRDEVVPNDKYKKNGEFYQAFQELNKIKRKIGWSETSSEEKNWWKLISKRYRNTPDSFLDFAKELEIRNAAINEIFSIAVESQTQHLNALLHYLDYVRLKRQEELKNSIKTSVIQ